MLLLFPLPLGYGSTSHVVNAMTLETFNLDLATNAD